jgi:carbon-monoxide dehydrogenase catalytic subunit
MPIQKKVDKKKKTVDPKTASIDQASIETLAKAQKDGVETIFDRALTMKPCNIGEQGTCCKMCAQGPCRMPLPKKGIEGDDTRKGLCGATPETVAARNFARMVAGRCRGAQSDHGRGVAEVFLAAARRETDDYKIQDTEKLCRSLPTLKWPPPRLWKKTAKRLPRSGTSMK